MGKRFRNPVREYVIGHFKQARRPTSPSPKLRSYKKRALTRDDHTTQCTYIHPQTNMRCENKLGIYPEFCELHTMLIQNVFIAPSKIKGAGNGLFVGAYTFKKGDVIGQYSHTWNRASLGAIEKRCDTKHEDKYRACFSYVFCDEDIGERTKCWDGVDIRSTIMRNINDAHGSEFRNNAYFDVVDGDVLVIASRNIKPYSEILVSYGPSYWQ